jgi:hypothetical protein
MSTMQRTRPEHTTKTRLSKGILALSAIIAIGVAILFLSLTGTHRAASPATTPEHAASPAAAPLAVTPPPPTGYFRDPTTHALLRIPSARDDGAVFRAIHGFSPIARP